MKVFVIFVCVLLLVFNGTLAKSQVEEEDHHDKEHLRPAFVLINQNGDK